ncbi:MAG: DNA polymerase III subunit delta [Clostridia bacterium]|nr:DNA polymerase III subunit delta [Clostridia bacterium]
MIFNDKTLNSALSRGEIAPCYFVWGEDPHLKAKSVERIVAAVVPDPEMREFISRFDRRGIRDSAGADGYLNAVIGESSTVPMFLERGLCVVRDFPLEKLSNAGVKRLKGFIEGLDGSTVVVFYFPSTEIAQKKGAPEKSRYKTVLKYFEDGGANVYCPHYPERECAAVAEKYAATLGGRLSGKNAQRLVELVGTDMGMLMRECEKLCSAADGGEISGELIDALAARQVSASMYEVSQAVFAADADRALDVLDRLEKDGVEPVVAAGALSGAFLDVFRLKIMLEGRGSVREVSEAFAYGARDFALDEYSQAGRANRAAARRLSMPAVKKCVDLLAQADVDLKGGSRLAPWDVMRSLVIRLVSEAGAC